MAEAAEPLSSTLQAVSPHQSKLLAHLLTLEGDTEQEMSRTLAGARVDMNPHQVEAALFAMRSPLSRGVILADEVGLGKTIEASLVIAQRWAERRRRIVLVVPATLRKQWAQELHEKFLLPSVVLEAKSVREEVKAGVANPFDRTDRTDGPEIVICSYQFAASKREAVKAVPWDLVVFDEAHKLRNVWAKSGAVTAKALKEAFEGRQKVLLSATPLQNSLIELYGLASIIDDHFFGPEPSFRANYMVGKTGTQNLPMLRDRLNTICARTLRRQVQAEGGISFTKRMSLTEDFTPTEEEQRLYESVSAYLQRENMRAFKPKSLSENALCPCDAAQQDVGGGGLNEGGGRGDGGLRVLPQSAIPAQPGESPLDYPAAGLHGEADLSQVAGARCGRVQAILRARAVPDSPGRHTRTRQRGTDDAMRG